MTLGPPNPRGNDRHKPPVRIKRLIGGRHWLARHRPLPGNSWRRKKGERRQVLSLAICLRGLVMG